MLVASIPPIAITRCCGNRSRALAQQPERCAHRGRLGDRGKDGSEGEQIRTGVDRAARQFDVVVTGHAEQQVRHTFAGNGNVAVIAAEVNAIGLEVDGQFDIVIDHEERPVPPCEGLQDPGLRAPLLRGCPLVAVLDNGDAGSHGGAEPGGHRVEVAQPGVRRKQIDTGDAVGQSAPIRPIS